MEDGNVVRKGAVTINYVIREWSGMRGDESVAYDWASSNGDESDETFDSISEAEQDFTHRF